MGLCRKSECFQNKCEVDAQLPAKRLVYDGKSVMTIWGGHQDRKGHGLDREPVAARTWAFKRSLDA